MELRCSWTLRQFDRGLSFLFTTERKGPREERSFLEPPPQLMLLRMMLCSFAKRTKPEFSMLSGFLRV